MYIAIKDGKAVADCSNNFRVTGCETFRLSSWQAREYKNGKDARVTDGVLEFYEGERFLKEKMKPVLWQYKKLTDRLRDRKQKYDNLVDIWKDKLAIRVVTQIEDIKAQLTQLEETAKDPDWLNLSQEQIDELIIV